MPTVENQLDLSLYAPALEVLLGDPNTRIMGSIGRMVVAHEAVGDAYVEFTTRQKERAKADRPSDLDVLGASYDVIFAAEKLGGVTVDARAFDDTDISIRNDYGTWVLQSAEADFAEAIKPELMEPVSAEIDGIEIVTVPLLTHQLLHEMRDRQTRKDRITSSTLGYLIHQTALTWNNGSIPHFNKEDVKPFVKLANILRTRPQTTDTRHSGERHSI